MNARKGILKFTIQLLFFSVAFIHANSQTQFLVCQLKGEAFKEKGGKQQLLKIGELLDPVDIIKMKSKTKVTLVCPNYTPVNLSEAGTYSVSSLSKYCALKSSSISSNYWKYVWAELTKHPSDPDEDRRKYMSNTGSATRGCPDITIPSLFDTVFFHSGSLDFTWETSLAPARMHFAIYADPVDKVAIMDMPLTRNCMPVGEWVAKLQADKPYYWGILVDGREDCPRKLLLRVSEASYAEEIRVLEQESGPVFDQAERLFMNGFLLEEKHFLEQAAECYRKAARIRKIPTYEKAAAELKAKLACR